MAKAKNISDFSNFETALTELNQLVEQMEQGSMSLEEALKNFERGIVLARTCQTMLKTAEQKVQILLEQNGQTTLTAFDAPNEEG